MICGETARQAFFELSFKLSEIMHSVTWHAVSGNESANVFGCYFEGKVTLVKYEALWLISLLMLPNCFERLAAEGHPAFNPRITFNLKVTHRTLWLCALRANSLGILYAPLFC